MNIWAIIAIVCAAWLALVFLCRAVYHTVRSEEQRTRGKFE